MSQFWHSAPSMKTLALALLATALVVIGAVHISSQKVVAIQGPGALQPVSADRVWMGVNNDLWVLDHSGRKVAQKTVQELGLPHAIANIVPAPDGQVLLSARGQATWSMVRASDMAVLRTITPQWPEQDKEHSARAVHLAVAPSGDIAVATGGGHSVLLFDPEGRFKAKTAKGAYYFTNGLWHSPEGWWTTDTNKFTLRLMDSDTLAEKRSIVLESGNPGYPWLAEMVPSKGAPKPGTHMAPLATLSRVGTMMEPGHVVDVFPDASQINYNQAPLARINDIAWLGEQLLVVDGGNYQVLRFSAHREALSNFGDTQVQASLADMLEQRTFWSQWSSRYMFLLAAALLLLGIAAYNRHKKLVISAVLVKRSPTSVGTPVVAHRLALQQWGVAVGLPLLVRLGVVLLLGYGLFFKALLYGLNLGLAGPSVLALAILWVMTLAILCVALWQQRHYLRYSRKPSYEGTLNRKAMGWLQNHDDWDRVKGEGEEVRETVLLRGQWLGLRQQWLLVTNRRVLLFAANARERRLDKEWPRSAVVFAGLPEQDPLAGKVPGRLEQWLLVQPNMRIRLRSGEVVTGISPSAVTAQRAAQLLVRARLPVALGGPNEVGQAGLLASAPRRRQWQHVAASLMLPGVGQWLQNRFATGTVFFTAAALLVLMGLGPVLWAMTGPKMHVDFLSKLLPVYVWLLLATTSAIDAYFFARSGKVARKK